MEEAISSVTPWFWSIMLHLYTYCSFTATVGRLQKTSKSIISCCVWVKMSFSKCCELFLFSQTSSWFEGGQRVRGRAVCWGYGGCVWRKACSQTVGQAPAFIQVLIICSQWLIIVVFGNDMLFNGNVHLLTLFWGGMQSPAWHYPQTCARDSNTHLK